MSTLSLAMIVRDESEHLPRCLKSVEGVFDQIVIVDTGSLDNTKQIAQSFGAEVYDFQWINDFSAARNYSISKCTCDYVMWVDADDVLSDDSVKNLKELKSSLSYAEIYLFPYDYSQDEYGNSAVSIFTFRIFKNDPAVTWRWPIHECLIFPPGWRSITLPEVIIKHLRTGDAIDKDIGRNIKILELAVKNQPKEPRMLYYYAKELFGEGRLEESIIAFQNYFDNGSGWHEDNINAHFMISSAYYSTGNEERAIDEALIGIKVDPRWAEFYNLIGQIYYNRQNWGHASYWFEIASRIPFPKSWGIVLADNYTWVPWDRLCMCYSQSGRLREAYEANEKALNYRPGDPRFLYNRNFLRNQLFPGRVLERPIRLSVGSGGKYVPSYRCTDLYMSEGIEEVFPQGRIPYPDCSIHALYSEHSLEHSDGHEDAENTIKEWARVLRHNGHLSLRVPDLQECCRQFSMSEDRPAGEGEKWSPKEWFKYTIYGIQKSQHGEPDEGQYHRTGFTEGSLRNSMERNGFEVLSIKTYDGFGTPSLELEAIQKRNPLKVVWIMQSQPDENHGSVRIRRLNVHNWFINHGVDSQILDISDSGLLEKARCADVAIFQSFGPVEKQLIESLSRCGVKCISDHVEDIFNLPYQDECFGAVDVVVCCSTVLAEKSQGINKSVCIPDAFETQV